MDYLIRTRQSLKKEEDDTLSEIDKIRKKQHQFLKDQESKGLVRRRGSGNIWVLGLPCGSCKKLRDPDLLGACTLCPELFCATRHSTCGTRMDTNPAPLNEIALYLPVCSECKKKTLEKEPQKRMIPY